jgi:transcriptional regulator GlxA family with amidase domain
MRYLSNLVIAHLLREQHSDAFSDYLYQLTKECYDQSWEDNVCDIRHSQAGISITDFRIRNSIRLMRDNFGEEIFLDNIARDSGLSRPHFYKLFRQNVGLTPNMYLNMLRMENAIDLLTTTTESITSIGLDMGFSSQASFTRFFTSNVGIAPTDYRRATVVCG